MRSKKNETVTLKKGSGNIHLDYTELRKAVLVLRAVNHKLRQRIIDLLESGEPMTVTDIYIKLRLEQSVASQPLPSLEGPVSYLLSARENSSTILSIRNGSLRSRNS